MKEKLFCSMIIASALGAGAMTPGGIEKKYVGLLFDVMNTTPSNILANADQFAEHAPYLDGVAIGLHDIPVVAGDGSVVTAQYYQIMHPTQRWTRDAVKDQLPILQKISQKPGLTESFLLFWMTPGFREARVDWADDKAWANYAENMATVAWLAKQGGMKGLMLDPEEYKLAPQYIHTYRDPPFEECAKLARQRAREVFSRVFAEFPDAVIFSLWFFNRFGYWMEGGRQVHPREYADYAGELSWHYYNGILDVMPPEARAVDGAEHYSGSSLDHAYFYDYVNASSGALAFVEPENVAKFRSQFYFGNTHYLDMYTLGANPKSRWYHGPVNGSRLEHLRRNMEQSLRVATKYVWIYGEGSGKLFNWRGGHYGKRKTWEEVIPGMTETIMLVKDPERYSAMRKAELKSKKQLVNLAAKAKGFCLEQPAGIRSYSQSEEKMGSVRGVKPGERYLVQASVLATGPAKASAHPGAACPRVVWRRDGKRISAKPVPVKVVSTNRWSGGEAIVEVPKDADELALELAASLELGEEVKFRGATIWKALDPVQPVKAQKPSKWVYDEKAKTLTDGNWKLETAAWKTNLTVRGADAQTVGSGVLDFSTVLADTGYRVTGLGRLRNHAGLTALIAPEVTTVVDGGVAGCTNLSSVTVGEIRVPGWATSPVSIRRSRLSSLGVLKELYKGGEVRFSHSRSSTMRPEQEISVKGVKPGELYSVGFSIRRRGAGWTYPFVRFRGEGKPVKSNQTVPALAPKEPRAEGQWRTAEVVVRVPEGADEIYFDISAQIVEGLDKAEFKDFEVIKLADPPPAWPPEALREKGM
ncbi:MAG: hypothetical protein IJQ73_03005 [Kiritimatiellae bacterium]|nr:hypothetical protein [Kiritimatiellia bacterium]